MSKIIEIQGHKFRYMTKEERKEMLSIQRTDKGMVIWATEPKYAPQPGVRHWLFDASDFMGGSIPNLLKKVQDDYLIHTYINTDVPGFNQFAPVIKIQPSLYITDVSCISTDKVCLFNAELGNVLYASNQSFRVGFYGHVPIKKCPLTLVNLDYVTLEHGQAFIRTSNKLQHPVSTCDYSILISLGNRKTVRRNVNGDVIIETIPLSTSFHYYTLEELVY